MRKKGLHFLEVTDGLMFTVDSDQNLIHAEAWAPGLDEWVTCTDLITPEIMDRHAQKIADKIAFDKEAA